MTNKEKYKEGILDYLINCSDIAIDKKQELCVTVVFK